MMSRASLPQLSLVTSGQTSSDSADSPQPAMESRLVSKRLFGRFELLIEMGRGGMATLYLARIQGPQQFEKLLAIKRIHDHLSYEVDFVNMFQDEARIAALIHHPNVATLFDMGQIDDSYFIAMEYVHGQTLTDILKAATRHRDRFPWPVAARIVANTAAGLHAAHTLRTTTGDPLDVVHRDVSPQNILISYDGHIKVVDFGIAYAAQRLHSTASGTLKGKVGYMSPEQTDGRQVDHRSDIFALGVVLYESATVSRLFRGQTDAETLLKVRQAEVPSARQRNPDLPAELDIILRKALARRPEDRYDSAEELSDALEDLLVKENQVVARQRVAHLMKDLFYDRRKLKDQQIRIALSTSDAAPLEGMRVEETSSSLLLPQYLIGKHDRSRRWRMLLLMSGLFAAVGLAAILLLWPGDQTRHSLGAESTLGAEPMNPVESPPWQPPVNPPVLGTDRASGIRRLAPIRAAAQRAATVTLTIEVKPRSARAKVVFGGRTHRGTNVRLATPRSAEPTKLRVIAPGYITTDLLLMPTADARIRIKLERRRRRTYRRSRPKTHRRRGRAPLLTLPD
jgi:eukaryotic-like serine/threonine-protein kinase